MQTPIIIWISDYALADDHAGLKKKFSIRLNGAHIIYSYVEGVARRYFIAVIEFLNFNPIQFLCSNTHKPMQVSGIKENLNIS